MLPMSIVNHDSPVQGQGYFLAFSCEHAPWRVSFGSSTQAHGLAAYTSSSSSALSHPPPSAVFTTSYLTRPHTLQHTHNKQPTLPIAPQPSTSAYPEPGSFTTTTSNGACAAKSCRPRRWNATEDASHWVGLWSPSGAWTGRTRRFPVYGGPTWEGSSRIKAVLAAATRRSLSTAIFKHGTHLKHGLIPRPPATCA